MFSCEFCEISNSTFFTEHLWTTASESLKKVQNYQQINQPNVDWSQSILFIVNFEHIFAC